MRRYIVSYYRKTWLTLLIYGIKSVDSVGFHTDILPWNTADVHRRKSESGDRGGMDCRRRERVQPTGYAKRDLALIFCKKSTPRKRGSHQYDISRGRVSSHSKREYTVRTPLSIRPYVKPTTRDALMYLGSGGLGVSELPCPVRLPAL